MLRLDFLRSSSIVFTLLVATAAVGQNPINTPPPSKPPAANIDQYIHEAWGTLSRSMTDCHSLTDPKLTTEPVLYLPKDLPMPASVQALSSQCKVDVERLPRVVTHFGELKLTDVPVAGLLYLPNKYVVPGGRFNEMYGWDSYFIILGLLRDGHVDLAQGMVENFFFEIEHYGGILNANRTYYFTRSQPPFLSSMIRDVYEAQLQRDPKAAQQWLARSYSFAQRDHALWTSDIHRAGDTGLARYYDIGNGPVPEEDDDTTYYSDVIRWLLKHPRDHPEYLVSAPDQPNAAAQAKLAIISCNPRISAVCARAHVDGHWLSHDFYKGDRAMRESGYDPSFRFGPFDGSTHHYAPVCLNSLLYKYELDLAWMAEKLGKPAETARWKQEAAARKAAINKYLWNAADGMYYDYDYVAHRRSTYKYLTTFFPLWAGVANEQQIKGLHGNVHVFNHPGGMAMSTYESGVQWDLPFGWAPPMWITTAGLLASGDVADARMISQEFTQTIRENFARDHTIREKYDVANSSSHVEVATGYKTNVVGFGWTNAAYLEMEHLLAETRGAK
ncbi:trehalase family glycosidase [Acidipila rosea]|uniref:Alpha,alpha-trehalase n=1 Tax=Acidipila rosea TaxID=768535 RepID=A0A4R1L687_9BACT|nr:trehalase family glycosidase [Acidipila rosea]TCK72570.1 alpha,alpha-trehalase [Acidipila rosea]